METVVKHINNFKALAGSIIFFFDDLTLEWKLGLFVAYLLVTTAIDRYTITKNIENNQVKVEEITKELNEVKKQFETKSSALTEKNDAFVALNRKYSTFVNVNFLIFVKALESFYEDFRLRQGNKSGLKSDVDQLKTLSTTATTLFITETEEVKHVEGNLPRNSDTK